MDDGPTDYGYRLNGIEYATDTEAFDAEDDDQQPSPAPGNRGPQLTGPGNLEGINIVAWNPPKFKEEYKNERRPQN